MFNKNTDDSNEKDIGELTPGKELIQDLKKLGIAAYIYIGVAFIISVFISGTLYQYYKSIFSGETIYILSSFKFGITKMIIVTLLFFVVFVVGGYRIYRSLKRNYLYNYKDDYMKSKKNTFGGAHFQTEEEMLKKNADGISSFSKFGSIDETDGHIFGEDSDGNIFTFNYPPGMNRNKILFGAPGSGKSAAIIKTDLYQAIRRGDSLIVTDSKGDLYAQTSAVAKEHGYIVRVLNLKATEFKNSDGFNFFASLHADDPNLDAKADVIANTIIKNTTNNVKGTDDYWALNEFNLIKCIVMYIATEPTYVETNRNTLPELFNFLSQQNPASLKAIFGGISNASPIKICYDIFANCEERNQGQIINGVNIRLSKLTNNFVQKALSFNEIDPILPLIKKCIYYVIISDTTDAYKFISSLFFSTLISEQCEYSDRLTTEQKKNQKEVIYLLDEYRATGGIYGLPVNIATLRSRKIALTIILQDKGQLNTMYTESEVSTILNCCTIKGLLSTNDDVTAEYFSTLLGKQTVIQESNRYEESASDLVHAHATTQKTLGESERDLLSIDELINGTLPRDELIYIISGLPPVKLKKCFAEKSGVRIHPLEIESEQFGEKKPHLHKPKWRKVLEDKAIEKGLPKDAFIVSSTLKELDDEKKPEIKTPEESKDKPRTGYRVANLAPAAQESEPEEEKEPIPTPKASSPALQKKTLTPKKQTSLAEAFLQDSLPNNYKPSIQNTPGIEWDEDDL